MKDSLKKSKFNRTIFSWYKQHGRELEWRKTQNPYRIVVSEIMLQQTQVDRVKEKYRDFLKQFPTIKDLANAPLSSVLHVWSGLGYNRRAKYLYEMAKVVVTEHSGRFPRDRETLLKLPGIGPSTASALGAFAFARDEVMIDTNIRRVLSRTFYGDNIPTDKELYLFGSNLIPKGKGRDWNYAVMDIASQYCKARGHDDEKCPLQELHGEVGDFIYKKPQSRFAGSPRYYRGQVIKYLLRSKDNKSVRLETMINDLGFAKKDILTAVEKLKEENMLLMRGKSLCLPE